MIVYLNGNFINEEEAQISVFDHGLLYGDGVFEGIKVYNGRIFALEEHIDRFYESAQSIQLELPLSRDDMKKAIIETVRRNNLMEAYIRLVASRGKGTLGLDPRNCPEPTVVIIVDSETRHPEDTAETPANKKGIKVITACYRRNSHDVLSPRIKSTNYLNNILAKLQANSVGVQDAIFLNTQGFVSELTADNIFIVKKSRLITPSLSCGILDGITRQTVLRIAKTQGLEAVEEALTLHDLYTSQECFCTATRIEILPVVWIDGRQVGLGTPGPVTSKIEQGFRELVSREGTSLYDD